MEKRRQRHKELGLSVRAYNCIKNGGLPFNKITVGNAITSGRFHWRNITNLGPISFQGICNWAGVENPDWKSKKNRCPTCGQYYEEELCDMKK